MKCSIDRHIRVLYLEVRGCFLLLWIAVVVAYNDWFNIVSVILRINEDIYEVEVALAERNVEVRGRLFRVSIVIIYISDVLFNARDTATPSKYTISDRLCALDYFTREPVYSLYNIMRGFRLECVVDECVGEHNTRRANPCTGVALDGRDQEVGIIHSVGEFIHFIDSVYSEMSEWRNGKSACESRDLIFMIRQCSESP